LEHDNDVLKWLRPAQNQFHIYWKHNSRQYTPDFVVETDNNIFMVETKKKDEIDISDVREKAFAATTYCSKATEFTQQNSGRSWKYSLIPHHVVMPNMSFNSLVSEYEFKNKL
jgi:type III restriction enzyme